MPRRYLNPDEIGADPSRQAVAISGRMIETLPDRCIRYAFSDASVGRDMHTIAPDAWDLANFQANPVFLWAHCDDELPVGRVEDLARGQRLTGLVRYAEHDFADTVYSLVRGGFLNATSTGWLPLEWRAANDRKRPGGLDFTRVELLEISQVPVPALPTALVTARKAGVDTRPLVAWAERLLDAGDFAVLPRRDLEALRKAARMPKTTRAASGWTCGAARDLPIDDKTRWDGEEAAGRMLDAATSEGKLDPAKAKRGFLLYDASAADERGAYKEPFADIVDGKLTAIAGGIRAAAQRLPDVKDVSDSARDEARTVIETYHKQLADEVEEPARGFAALARKFQQRDLCALASFAYFLAGVENLYDNVAAEAAREDDGSDLPAELRAWIDDGNRLLLKMAGEETAEQIAGTQDDYSPMYWSAATLEKAVARALAKAGVTRKGAKFSAETLRCMRSVHGHLKKAHEQLSDLLDDPDDENPENDDDNDGVDPEDEDSERQARAASEKKLRAASESQARAGSANQARAASGDQAKAAAERVAKAAAIRARIGA